jgi:hypothetical protein
MFTGELAGLDRLGLVGACTASKRDGTDDQVRGRGICGAVASPHSERVNPERRTNEADVCVQI